MDELLPSPGRSGYAPSPDIVKEVTPHWGPPQPPPHQPITPV